MQRDFKIARLIAFFSAQFVFFYCAPLLARLPHSVDLPETKDKWFIDMLVYVAFWQFMLLVSEFLNAGSGGYSYRFDILSFAYCNYTELDYVYGAMYLLRG